MIGCWARTPTARRSTMDIATTDRAIGSLLVWFAYERGEALRCGEPTTPPQAAVSAGVVGRCPLDRCTRPDRAAPPLAVIPAGGSGSITPNPPSSPMGIGS